MSLTKEERLAFVTVRAEMMEGMVEFAKDGATFIASSDLLCESLITMAGESALKAPVQRLIKAYYQLQTEMMKWDKTSKDSTKKLQK